MVSQPGEYSLNHTAYRVQCVRRGVEVSLPNSSMVYRCPAILPSSTQSAHAWQTACLLTHALVAAHAQTMPAILRASQTT